MTKYILLISFIFFSVPIATSQDVNILIRDAQKEEAVFREQEALAKYLEVLRYQPQHLNALCKTSELYNILGKRQQAKEKQKQHYLLAKKYAEQALRVNPNHAESNFVMSIAMGRMALISSGEEKIQAVREIRSYAEKCVRLDPFNYKGYHVLARWYLEVSNLSSLERWLVKVAYGALPKATLDDAIANYEKSRSLNPGLVVNYLELAKAYNRKGQETKAIEMLRTMEKLPNSAADDPKIKKEGRELLKELE
jgi:tetratricopeptide (TPR) repeat protein